MSVQIVILAVYAAVLLVIAWYSTKIQKSAKGGRVLNYLIAGRNMPVILVASMLTGLAIGGASTVGVAQVAYTKGFSAGWYNAAWCIGGIIAGILVIGHFRKARVKTVPEMMLIMFDSKTRTAAVISQLIVMISATAMQYVAGGAILAALLPDVFTFRGGMMASAAIFIFITVVGGYWASGLTNVINVIVIYIGIIVALIKTLSMFGGLSAIQQSFEPTQTFWLDPISGLGIAGVSAYVMVMATMVISFQASAQIGFAAKDEQTAKKGFLLGGILIFPAGFLCAIFGIAAAAKFPNLQNAAMALPQIVTQLPAAIGGIFLAALWAADISTAVGLLMGCSTIATEDIVKKIYTKPLTQSGEMIVSRIVVLFISLLSFGLALTATGILNVITTALSILTAQTILILSNIYFPKLCKKAAGFWMIIASVIMWAIWTYLPQLRVGPHLIYSQWAVCLVIFIITAIFAKEKAGSLIADKPA
ncbi:MAG: sodium:solute symporter family protein [Elusimicrobiota bacterium]|jgi:SSS family solute:Na+ symporter|nr:sodium:solute symporter family protein [Elusimicrobiota bacterium]